MTKNMTMNSVATVNLSKKGGQPWAATNMNTLITRLEQAGVTIVGVCLIAMMFIVSADAFGRYAFKAPIPWATDVVSYYLMAVIAYFTASATFRRGDHIHLDLFRQLMSRRTKAVTGIIYSVLSAAVFAVIAYGNTKSMIDSYQAREFVPGYLPWPVWLSLLPIVLGTALLTLRLIHHAMTLLVRGEDPAVSFEGEDIE